MADAADREVIFRLGVEVDPKVGKALADLGKNAAAVQQKMDRGAVASAQRRLTAQEKATAAAARSEERALAEWRKAQLRRESLAEKAAQRDAVRQQRLAEKASVTLQRQIAREAADREKASRSVEAMAQRGAAGMKEGFEQSTEAAMRFARGFVMLGLASEESTEKMLRGLVKVQGFFDLVVGGMKLVIGVQKLWEGISLAIQAAQAREIALRGANVVAINAETAALARKGVANAAASATGGAAGAAGVSGASVLGAKILGGAKYLGGLGLAAGKLAGIAILATEAIQGTRRALGDSSENAESFVGALVSWRKAAREAAESTEALSRSEQRRALALAMGGAQVERVRARAEADDSRAEIARNTLTRKLERLATTKGLTGGQRDLFLARGQQQGATAGVWDTQQQLDTARANLAKIRERNDMSSAVEAPGAVAAVEVARQRAVEASDRLREATDERLRAEHEIAEERIRAADEAISKAERERDVRLDAIKTEQTALRSAEERFGAMSTAEQQSLIRIQKKAAAGGDLSVAEAKRLESLGTRGGERIASDLYRRRADAAGFSQYFGAEERQEIGRLKKEAAALEVNIKDQRELKVTIQRDDQALAQRLVAAVDREMQVRDRLLEEMVSEKLQQSERRIAQTAAVRERAKEAAR